MGCGLHCVTCPVHDVADFSEDSMEFLASDAPAADDSGGTFVASCMVELPWLHK